MTTNLSITAAGRAALADQANTGVAAARLTHIALGDGRRGAGEDDDARVALRGERLRAAAAGRASAGGRVAVALDVAAPGATFSCTEIGLIARVGAADVLLAYWAAGAGDDPAFAVASATRLVVGVSLDVAQSAAEVAVTIDASVVFGANSQTVDALENRVQAVEDDAPEQATEAMTTAAAAADAAGDLAALNNDRWTAPRDLGRLSVALRTAIKADTLREVRGGVAAEYDTLAEIVARIAALEAASMRMARAKVEAKSTTVANAVWTSLGGNVPNLTVHRSNGVTVPAGKYLVELQGESVTINWGAAQYAPDALVRAAVPYGTHYPSTSRRGMLRGRWILDGGVTATLNNIHGPSRKASNSAGAVEQTGTAWLTLTKLA